MSRTAGRTSNTSIKKRKPKDNVGSLLNGGRTMITEDEEKTELLNTFFALVTTDKTSPGHGSGRDH